VQLDTTVSPVSVHADRVLIVRVIENLLGNAVRYTPVHGTISVGSAITNDKVTIFISDNGPGIAAQDMPHLFELFYRGETSRNAITGGSGLGLAIAQQIMRAHHGDLS